MFILPFLEKKAIQILLRTDEEETNVKNAIDKLHEIYPKRLIYDGKQKNCQIIEIMEI